MLAAMRSLALLLLCCAARNCASMPLVGDQEQTSANPVNDDVLIMGGRNCKYLRSVELYNVTDGHSHRSADMTSTRANFGAAAMGTKIYAVGGNNRRYYAFNTAEAFDVATDKWSSIAPMLIKRTQLAVAALDGYLYAIAGYDETLHSLSSVERYNETSGVWTRSVAFPQELYGLTAVSIGDCIYAVGGRIGHSFLATGYKLCTSNPSQWMAIAPMSTARFAHAAAALDGHLYVCGGYNNAIVGDNIASCERYNTKANKWDSVGQLPSASDSLAMVTVNGKLYAFGGSPRPVNVVRYDPRTNGWTQLADLAIGRYELAAVAIPASN